MGKHKARGCGVHLSERCDPFMLGAGLLVGFVFLVLVLHAVRGPESHPGPQPNPRCECGR